MWNWEFLMYRNNVKSVKLFHPATFSQPLNASSNAQWQSKSVNKDYLPFLTGSIPLSNISAFQQHSLHNFILLGMIILLKWMMVSRLGLEDPLGAARFPVQCGKVDQTIVRTWTGILRVSYTCLNLLRNTGGGDSFHFRTFCKISDHNALIGVKCVSNADTDLGCVLWMTAPHPCLVDRFGARKSAPFAAASQTGSVPGW